MNAKKDIKMILCETVSDREKMLDLLEHGYRISFSDGITFYLEKEA